MLYRKLWIALIAAGTLVIAVWLAFQPRVANHFGYGLPITNGLPCRLGALGRHYDNNEQCLGMNRSSWSIWYASHHHVPEGGVCATPADLRRTGAWPLRQIGSIFTLFGSSHPIDLAGTRSSLTPTVLFVKDGTCYRAYALSGGP